MKWDDEFRLLTMNMDGMMNFGDNDNSSMMVAFGRCGGGTCGSSYCEVQEDRLDLTTPTQFCLDYNKQDSMLFFYKYWYENYYDDSCIMQMKMKMKMKMNGIEHSLLLLLLCGISNYALSNLFCRTTTTKIVFDDWMCFG